MALWPYSYFIPLPFHLLLSFVHSFLSSLILLQIYTPTTQAFIREMCVYYHVLALSQAIMHYLFERSKHPSAHDYSHSATLDELWINRCWCWMHATPAYVCMCLCSRCKCVARTCVCYTYMQVYSALMSLQVSPCSPPGLTLWVQRSRARSGAWAGHPAAAHRGATVLLLLPPSDQRTAWVLQFQPQHKTLVSGFPQSNPATAEAPFVPTLNKT